MILTDCNYLYTVKSVFLKLECVPELPGGLGEMQLAGCYFRSFSLVVSAKKTIKQDEVIVCWSDTTKTGFIYKGFIWESAFERK